MTQEFSKSEKTALFGVFLLMGIVAFSVLAILVWAVYSSFKNELDYALNVLGLPKKGWHFDNYTKVLSQINVKITTASGQETVGFVGMFINSVEYAVLHSLMNVLMPSLVGYVVARYTFKGRGFIQGLNIFVMILPILGNLPAKLMLLKALGIYNNMVLYCLTQVTPFGFNFLLMTGAFKGLSESYSEAAFIDGASHLQVMLKIMWPMMLPTFAMLFILSFVSCWNTYSPFLFFLPKFPNLFLGMYYFQNNASINYATMTQILAGLLIVAVPSAILYLSSQKLLASKFIIGGLKG